MKKSVTTAAVALALGLVWTAGPALAADIKEKAADVKDTIKDKAEDLKDKIHDKGSDLKDKVESKTHRDKDKAADRVDRTADKAETTMYRAADKTESTMDKAKDKAHDAKDKVKDKTADMKDKASAKMHHAGKADVSATQQALKDKGFDPGPVDGRMGPHTKTALRDFQKKEGLKATGRMDNDTMARLGVATSKADTTMPAASPATTSTTPPSSTMNTPTGAHNNAGTTAPATTPDDKNAPQKEVQKP